MRRLIPLVVFAFCAAAQTPNLSGVWTANLQKSHIAGPPVTQYLVMFQPTTGRKGQKLVKSITGMHTKYGLEKSVLTFRDDGKPMTTPYEGIPTRVTASWHGSELTMTARVAGTPRLIESTYRLSVGGRMLTIDSTVTGGRRPEHSTIVLAKQPQSAAAPLLAPEPTAGEHFKNVKTAELKNLPVSQFIDHMHYFAWSLGTNCEFCHVRGDFASDQKKHKKRARKMIHMAATIDQVNFHGHPNVRCFTCHEGHHHPLRYPQFAKVSQ
ncbi:MAG TPA: photosynthetic reaction center cytochrome c subunit family protein [Bryobacteraceae bacterium]